MTITISRRSVLASGAAAAIASGASVARASAATTSTTASPLRIGVTQRLLTAAEHSAFPGSALLSDGRLALTWRQGDAHAGGSDGRLMWSTSSTKGATWERPTVLLDDPDIDLRDPSLSRYWGSLHLTYFKTAAGGGVQLGAYTMRSDDDGTTWGPAVRIDSGVANAAMTSPLMFAGGRLRAFFYDSTVGRLNSIYTAESTDSGATWGNERMLLDGPAAGRDYNEPVSVRFPRGRLVLFFRWGMHSGIGRLESRDNGATWSHLSRVVGGVSGRPSVTRLASGLLVMAGRLTTGNRASVILTSRDAGLTWSSRRVLDVPGQLATYAAPVEVSTGVVCCPFGSQDSGTEASLMVRYLGMPGTVTPFREVIGS